jgi:hypothetical protein
MWPPFDQRQVKGLPARPSTARDGRAYSTPAPAAWPLSMRLRPAAKVRTPLPGPGDRAEEDRVLLQVAAGEAAVAVRQDGGGEQCQTL